MFIAHYYHFIFNLTNFSPIFLIFFYLEKMIRPSHLLSLLFIQAIQLQVNSTYSCNPQHACMACSATVPDQCDACFNWGSGTLNARQLDASSMPRSCNQ
jgi:hypothetical protein